MLIIVCGLQGTGKSTVAQKVAQKTGAALLRTDVIRKELFPTPKYSAEEMEKVYEEMFQRAKNMLTNNPVILDATFKTKKLREQARQLAMRSKVPHHLVHVTCDESVVKDRITKRENDASDARFEQYLHTKKEFEPIVDEYHIRVDTTRSHEEIDQQLKDYF